MMKRPISTWWYTGSTGLSAQALVKQGIRDGKVEGLSEEMWRKVYEKRKPEIPYDQFVLHETAEIQPRADRGHVF